MLEIKKLQAVNPYIAGRALNQDRGFVGRDDIFELVANEMLSPDRNAVVMFGQRRIGKTSILLQLQRRLPGELFAVIYFDLMDHASVSLGRLLFELATVMAEAVAIAPPAGVFDDEGIGFRHEFLPRFYQALGQERRPVLMFDEFDVLASGEERQLNASAAGRSFFPYVRRLMEGEPRLGFVFVAGRKAEELSMDVKAAFKTARYKRVSVLDEKNARELVLTAERQGTLSFTKDAVARILKLTAGHPYFTQLVCQLIWDDMHARDGGGIPRVDAKDVDTVVVKAPEAGENIFEWIWDGLPPAEKVIYAAIANATETRPYVSSAEVIDVLQRHGVRFLTRELELAPETLVKWEMLEEHDGKYGFFIELMRRWVAARKPLPRVKDELDRMVPLADTLYQSGDGFYRRGALDNSQNLLQQALAVNPNHLKARLLLGQVLVEQGRLEDAVRELDEAYRYDSGAAQYPLVRTLLLREEDLERNAEVDADLAICDRVQQLSPGHKVAEERRLAIWRQRGDKAFAADRLEEAVAAYQQIGATDMLEKVAQRKKTLHIEKLTRDAQAQEVAEQWSQACETYKKLAVQEPNQKAWKDAVERCQTEHNYSRLYSEALQAMKAENWKKAQGHLIEIMRTRPDFKDAPELLARALQPPQAPPPPPRPPVVKPFLLMYAKCAIAVIACVAAGVLRVNAGKTDWGTTIAFCLGGLTLLGFVLIVVEVAAHFLLVRREPLQTVAVEAR